MTRRDVGACLVTVQSEIKSKCSRVLLALLIAALVVGLALYHRSGSLERCLGRHLRERAASHLEVVHFGAAQVAAHVGEPLGEQLWACSQLQHALRAAAAAATNSSTACEVDGDGGGDVFDGEGGGGGGSGRCGAFLEFFGPGLCAFDVAVQLPFTAVGLMPSYPRLANVSAALTGLHRGRMRLLEGGGDGGGGGLDAELKELLPAAAVAAAAPPPGVVVQVNLHHAGGGRVGGGGDNEDAEDDKAALEVVRKLLERGAVHAAVLVLPTAPAATAGAAAAATARLQAASLLGAAAAGGLAAFWGGFDGVPVSEQDLRERPWPPPGAAAAAAAPASAPNRATVATLFLARRRAPPPAVHVLAPLRAADPSIRSELVGQLCRYLLDTAAASNMTVHVAGLTLSGPEFEHRMVKSQKLPVLLHALAAPSVAPSDVVLIVDATDTLAQTSTAALLERYLARGAPVMTVATEINCWPPQFVPWCRFYDGGGGGEGAGSAGAPAVAAVAAAEAGAGAGSGEVAQQQQRRSVLAEGAKATAAAAQRQGGKEEVERRSQGGHPSPLPNRFINSGGFMGRAVVVEKYLRDIVESLRGPSSTSNWLPGCCSCLEPDDQALLACAYLFDDNPYGITMDIRTDFFYSVFLASQNLAVAARGRGGGGGAGGGGGGGAVGWRWANNLTNATPAIVHGNGWDGKARLEALRGLIVGSAERADPGYEFWLDGQRTRYDELCPPAEGEGEGEAEGV
ncbi:hypothetical protein PLESTM_000023100 [Pleodorina starrii]|nr:hypothetical protein PLESTM_000023100 [Pleodorina starrii]